MYFKKLALIMAMDAEARPMIKRFNLSWKGPLNPRLPMMLYVGKHKKSVINLITSGECSRFMVDHIGTQPAVLSTHLAIDTLSPDIIINPGTAGGFIKANASVGDVYLGHPQVCYHDRRINLPGFKEYGIGHYPTYQSDIIAEKMNLKTGVVTSGSSLDYTPHDLEIMSSYDGIVKDMEAASVAWVAQLYNIPFIAIKAITDLIDGNEPTEEEFLKNLHLASEMLCEKTFQLVDYLTTGE
ncbi:MAG TPA: hypothetical protein PLF99_04010 [Tenuifilaceae bacterium]|nr:hypothetical protein [Tenuifilaceae bacterium]